MVQAIIMAGGEGSRLRPLTCDRPKPMVPVANKPVMEHAVRLLKRHGISDIGVTLQYLPQEIIKYFDDGFDFEANMHYYIEDKPLGTAGSVKNTGNFLKETFVVISGDALTDFDLTKAIDFHKGKGAMVTIVLTRVNVPLEYGVVITNEKGNIQRFLEKPGWGEVFSDTVNTGIYILEPEILDYIPHGEKYDFSQDLFPRLLADQKPMYGLILEGYWCDIGNIKQYQESHEAILAKVITPERDHILSIDGIELGMNCSIHPSATLESPVILGDDCRIEKNAVVGPNVVLGSNSVIDEGATIKRSVLWNGVYIGKRSEIRGAVICNRVRIKDRSMVLEGAVIGDGTVLEPEVKIKPDIKIWPHKVIEKGTTVDKHLVWGTKGCKSLFGSEGVRGKINQELTPEFTARLAAAFGAAIGPGKNVLVSCEGNQAVRMLQDSFQTGLMSMAVNVLDGGGLLTPVHRYAVKNFSVDAGIHIKMSSDEPDVCEIVFFNENGLLIPRRLVRKIENLFERDDFQRANRYEIGQKRYSPSLTDDYLRYLFGHVEVNLIRSKGYRAVVYFDHGSSLHSETLSYITQHLGCYTTGSDGNIISGIDADEMVELTAGQVIRTGADFGVIIERNAEKIKIIDERGKLIEDHELTMLMAMAYLEKSDNPVVAVPVTGSQVVERLAAEKKGKVIRTKNATASYMDVISTPEVLSAQGSINQSAIVFDGFSTLCFILEYMSYKGMRLGELADLLPNMYMKRKDTDCPWESKSSVIRTIIEENREKVLELIDGVKIYHDNGWALILPDPQEPRFNVYAEGSNYEFSESLADFYINRINQLKEMAHTK